MTATERGALLHPGRLDGIDVSWVQRGMNYQRVAAAGFRWAVVKCSEGTTGRDPAAVTHIRGFRDVGMYALAYTFLRPSQGNAKLQVRRLWDSMGDTYTRMVIDLETRNEQTSNRYLIDFAEEAALEVLAHGALRAVLYTYPNFARSLQPELGRSRLGELTDLWMADYRSPEPSVPPADYRPYVPLPWGDWLMHQYSGNNGFRVPGVPGACDRNVFHGDEETFRQVALGLPPRPGPAGVA